MKVTRRPPVIEPLRAYMGVDPGKSGAVCLLTPDQGPLFLDWPKNNDILTLDLAMRNWLYDYTVVFAILEHFIPRPAVTKGGQAQTRGAKSMFTFGQNHGIWLCLLTILRIPFQLMDPQSWQKGLVVRSDGPDPKVRARVAVGRFWPTDIDAFCGPMGGWKDGRADAALMAEKARRLHEGAE